MACNVQSFGIVPLRAEGTLMFVMGGPPNVLDVPCASLCFDWSCEFLVGAFSMHSLEDLVLERFAIHLVLAQIMELAADAIIYLFDALDTIISICDRFKD